MVMCGMVSTSWRRKSICEPSIRPAIMMVKPTPMETPAMPTSVCRTRAVTWVHAMSNRSFVVMQSNAHRVSIRGGRIDR